MSTRAEVLGEAVFDVEHAERGLKQLLSFVPPSSRDTAWA
jgi:hypothetical protein